MTIALYSPAFGYRFVVWDDHDYVTANPHIRGLGWSNIKWAFTSTYASNWHPLTWLSHAFDYQLFALNPAGHHVDNVLIHALNAVLLFLLLVWVTKRTGPSLLVGALFALHPLNVESVAWVAERKNVLSTLFFLLAIGAYVRYVQKPEWRKYLLVVGLFTAGLMAKPMVITLPFVLLLLDFWPLGRVPGSPPSPTEAPQLALSKLALEKIPLLALSTASALITLRAQRSAVRSFAEFPFFVRLENVVVSDALYLRNMIWPTRLAALYPHPPNLLPTWQVALSTLILVSITVLVVLFRRKRYLPVGWFWFLGTLVPVSGLVQVGEAAMADRYAYLTLIGIFVMIAWGLDDWAEAKKIRTIWLVVPAFVTLMMLSWVTFREVGSWASEYAVWAHTLDVTEQNPGAHGRLAAALLNPETAMTHDDLQYFDTGQKRMEAAREHYEEALRLDYQLAKQNPEAYLSPLAMILNDFGVLDKMQNRIDEQRRHYGEALQYFRQLAKSDPATYLPHLGLTLYNLGNLDLRENQRGEARRYYEEALRIQTQLAQQTPNVYRSDLASTLVNLGNLDLIENRLDDAHEHCEEALKIQSQLAQQSPELYQSDVAMTLYNLGTLDLRQNRLEDARQHFEKAMDVYRQLAKKHPGRYRQDMVDVMTNLEALQKSRKQPDATDPSSGRP
ncbi:MAG: tetratricopeptide repeat protein [Terriglobales bacterium]